MPVRKQNATSCHQLPAIKLCLTCWHSAPNRQTTKRLPNNAYWAPTVLMLEKQNEVSKGGDTTSRSCAFVTLHLRLIDPQEGSFILYDEATLTPPDNATLLDEEALAPIRNASGSPANASAMPTNVRRRQRRFVPKGTQAGWAAS